MMYLANEQFRKKTDEEHGTVDFHLQGYLE